MHTLEQVLDQLDRWHQRATYGAVAGLVGGRPQSLMQRRAHCPRDSWIVNARTQRPTAYSADETHPSLDEQPHVIGSADELATWVTEHRGPRRVGRPTDRPNGDES